MCNTAWRPVSRGLTGIFAVLLAGWREVWRCERLRSLAVAVAGAAPWPLLAVLTVQAVLSLRLVWSNTAFQDEALYLWAGRLEWAHWLHGAPIPAFPTYFSGAPVIYPPLGALADSIGGLALARLLSLAFMLGATSLLWASTERLYGKRAAFFAAALFAVLGPTLHLSAFATYDAMALFFVALATWCVLQSSQERDASRWMLAAAGALVLANATKYASALFDPVVIIVAVLAAFPMPGGKYAAMRGAALGGYVTAGLIFLVTAGGGYYAAGVGQTTLTRSTGGDPPFLVLDAATRWTGTIIAVAVIGSLISVKYRREGFRALLPLVFAFAALLAPLEQARIHTLTSLDKHADFGVWFAAAAAGYAVGFLISRLRAGALRLAATGLCTALVAMSAPASVAQARSLYAWPNAAALVAILKPMADGEPGRLLVEVPSVSEYYLAAGSDWKRWSNTRSVILPSGHSISVPVGAEGDPNVYAHFIRTGYFSVVALNFQATTRLDHQIAGDLARNPAYHVAATVKYGYGQYVIWRYEPGGAR